MDRNARNLASRDIRTAIGIVLGFTIVGPWIGLLAAAIPTFGISLLLVGTPQAVYILGGVPAFATGAFAAWYRRRSTRWAYIAACGACGAVTGTVWPAVYDAGGVSVATVALSGFPGAVAGVVCAGETFPRRRRKAGSSAARVAYDSRAWTGRS